MPILIPEDNLGPARAVEVRSQLVVMFIEARFLNRVALPRLIHMWVGISPPPNLVALVVARGDEVQIAVTVHVQSYTASFDVQRLRLDYRARPGPAHEAIEHRRIRRGTLGDHEAGMPVMGKIGNG